MNRLLTSVVGIGAVMLALVLAVAGNSAATPKTAAGTVGPGFTISLKQGGVKVTRLPAGARYRLIVKDLSPDHNFHISGPGVDKVVTTVGFTGTKSILLTLKKGTYTFVCDPHSSFMRGTFKVR